MSARPRLGPLADEVIDERYTVERQLGEGGMGAVFLARHNVTGRRVALKWVESDDKSLRQRLLREARAIAKVSHPSVVDVLDAGEHGDGVYIVLEYLSGDNLRGHLAGRTLAPSEAVQLLMPALEGVAAAHQAGILHRDLKPENLFVCIDADGAVFDTKVLDFGISKQVLGDAARAPTQTALTQQGHIVGTPEYMAPEQISHQPVLDERTDVYALGLVLYELLAGRLPYETRELRALLLDIVRGELPSPSRFRQDLPGELCKVVMKALASSPGQRYENVASFARALEPWSNGRAFEPPRKLGAAHDAAHTAKTMHRSGAVLVDRSQDEARMAPRVAISTITHDAAVPVPATREQRSLKPRKRSDDRSEAALAAPLQESSSSAPRVPEQRGLRITIIALLVVIFGGLAYAWLRPVPGPAAVAPVAVEPAAQEVQPAAAPPPVVAAPRPVLEPVPAPAPPPVAEPAPAAPPKKRKRVAASAPTTAAQPAPASDPKSVEVKTRAGTFGKKDF